LSRLLVAAVWVRLVGLRAVETFEPSIGENLTFLHFTRVVHCVLASVAVATSSSSQVDEVPALAAPERAFVIRGRVRPGRGVVWGSLGLREVRKPNGYKGKS